MGLYVLPILPPILPSYLPLSLIPDRFVLKEDTSASQPPPLHISTFDQNYTVGKFESWKDTTPLIRCIKHHSAKGAVGICSCGHSRYHLKAIGSHGSTITRIRCPIV